MNLFVTFIEGILKIFITKNAFLKHLFFIVITGLTTCFQYIKENIDTLGSDNFVVNHPIICLLVSLVAVWYMFGFKLKFWHNIWLNESNDIMPSIDLEPFKIALMPAPLIICWVFYFILISIVCFAWVLLPIIGYLIVGLIIIPFALYCTFFNFIYIAFSKDYDSEGLYDITLPFKYVRWGFVDWLLLSLLCIPFVIFMILIFLVPYIIFTLVDLNPMLESIISALVIGYLFFITQTVFDYCLAKIYIEKIEPNLE